MCFESCMFENVKCRRNKTNHGLALLSKESGPVRNIGAKSHYQELRKI